VVSCKKDRRSVVYFATTSTAISTKVSKSQEHARSTMRSTVEVRSIKTRTLLQSYSGTWRSGVLGRKKNRRRQVVLDKVMLPEGGRRDQEVEVDVVQIGKGCRAHRKDVVGYLILVSMIGFLEIRRLSEPDSRCCRILIHSLLPSQLSTVSHSSLSVLILILHRSPFTTPLLLSTAGLTSCNK
jgi:hypothetical protein